MRRFFLERATKATMLGVLLAAVGSCTFFHGFTTYFNVLYLAQKHLDIYEDQLNSESSTQSGTVAAASTHHWLEEELLTYKIRKEEGGPVAIFPLVSKPKVSLVKGGASTHLDSAVILGSKVLADKKPTKYVEDALFIVGKALYYKGDYSGAKRKFYELLYSYPDTKHADETAMLLAETLVSSGQTDSAVAQLEGILSRRSASDKQLRSEIHKTFADILVSSSYDSYDQATKELLEAEEGISGNQVAQLEYDRGRLFFVLEKFAEAEKAFANASELATDITFKGEVLAGLGEALRRENRFDEARKVFTDVKGKTRYNATRPAAQYELAYTADAEARSKVNGVLRADEYINTLAPAVKNEYWVLDTTYRTLSQAIMVRSRYRQAEMFREMGQYDSAAHLANIIIGTKDFSTSEMNDFVNNRMRALSRFAEWKSQLTKIDTVEFILGKMRRHEGMAATVNAELRNDAMKEFIGPKWSPGENYTLTPADERKLADIMEKIRRQKAAAGSLVFSIDFNDTARYIDSVHRVAARAHFELGRALESFDEKNDALTEYKTALGFQYYRQDTAALLLKAQVLFSWVQLDNDLGKVDERDSLITILKNNYGETKYALQAAQEYGGKRAKDSPGEVAFRSAESTLRTSSLDAAKPAFLNIVSTYTHEDVAARSLYAIALSYEDLKRYDSSLYYYYRLTHEYPFSRYTEISKPKVSYAIADYEKKHTAKAPPPVPDSAKLLNPSIQQSSQSQSTIKRTDSVSNPPKGGAVPDSSQSVKPATIKSTTPSPLPKPVKDSLGNAILSPVDSVKQVKKK